MSERLLMQPTPEMDRQIDDLVDKAQLSYTEAAERLGYEFEATEEQVLAGAVSQRPVVDTSPRGIQTAIDNAYYTNEFGLTGAWQHSPKQREINRRGSDLVRRTLTEARDRRTAEAR